jgi:hypothetical protein
MLSHIANYHSIAAMRKRKLRQFAKFRSMSVECGAARAATFTAVRRPRTANDNDVDQPFTLIAACGCG